MILTLLLYRLFRIWSTAQHCFLQSKTFSVGLGLKTYGPSFSWTSADRFFLSCPYEHSLLTINRTTPSMTEMNRIILGQSEQDLALKLYISGSWPVNDNYRNSLKSQWNQRPNFPLKMVNVFIWYWSPNKPAVPGLVCCIYFKGELSETTTICLSCVFTKQEGVQVFFLDS